MMGTLSPQGRLALSLEWEIWPSDARGVAQSVKGCTRRDMHQATWRAVFQAATALSSTNSKSDISNAGPSSGRAELPRAARQHCCLSRVPIGIGGCCNGPSLEAVGGEKRKRAGWLWDLHIPNPQRIRGWTSQLFPGTWHRAANDGQWPDDLAQVAGGLTLWPSFSPSNCG